MFKFTVVDFHNRVSNIQKQTHDYNSGTFSIGDFVFKNLGKKKNSISAAVQIRCFFLLTIKCYWTSIICERKGILRIGRRLDSNYATPVAIEVSLHFLSSQIGIARVNMTQNRPNH